MNYEKYKKLRRGKLNEFKKKRNSAHERDKHELMLRELVSSPLSQERTP